MNSLGLVKNFDDELFAYFEKESEIQKSSLSFIPDENSTSPLSAAITGSVLINSSGCQGIVRSSGLEDIVLRRLCKTFNADRACVRTITIEAASRVVFQALTKRGDVVMSLDLRKKEHCNSESLAFRFVNFGVDSANQVLNMDEIEEQAKSCHPKLIIVSPINYSLRIDFERFAQIASACGAYLWCDISQTAGLTAAGVLPNPFPYADIVTFNTHGAMQGPQSSVILCKSDLVNVIERSALMSGNASLLAPQLASLAARLKEMEDKTYTAYSKAVIENAKALASGLLKGGMKIVSGGTETHLVMIDAKNCAMSARGAQELLLDFGIRVRICSMLTADPNVRFDSVRFSSMPATTRGISARQIEDLGEAIGIYLLNPNDFNGRKLKKQVAAITAFLPLFNTKWLSQSVRHNVSDDGIKMIDATACS